MPAPRSEPGHSVLYVIVRTFGPTATSIEEGDEVRPRQCRIECGLGRHPEPRAVMFRRPLVSQLISAPRTGYSHTTV
jgi:hypothetical protein